MSVTSTYHYRARTPEGLHVNGSMQAASSEVVVAHLRTRALFVTTVVEGATLPGRIEGIRYAGPVPGAPLVAFFRSFATLVRAGVQLRRALEVTIAQCADARLREALRAVLAEIEAGRSLSSAMKLRPREFPPLHVAIIEAGEAGGLLDDVLDRLATLLERDQALQKKVGAALAYPAFVTVGAIVLVFFLIATIVPQFARMFAQMDVPLPLSTKILLAFGEATHRPEALIGAALVLAAAAAGYVTARRSPRIRVAIDRLRIDLPIAGPLLRKTIIARIARMLGSLLHAGVDLLHAIDVVGPISGNAAYAAALRDLHAALREGDSISEPLAASKLFEPLALQLIAVGEETGTIDTMMLRIADFYETDVETTMMTVSALLEPILICVVGIMVGAIVYSIFVPLYTLVGQIH